MDDLIAQLRAKGGEHDRRYAALDRPESAVAHAVATAYYDAAEMAAKTAETRMIEKMFLIEIDGGVPAVRGPYGDADERRAAFFELRRRGREVYTLDTYRDGDAYVGLHHGEGP